MYAKIHPDPVPDSLTICSTTTTPSYQRRLYKTLFYKLNSEKAGFLTLSYKPKTEVIGLLR